MGPGKSGESWLWKLNNLWYALGVLVVRWLLPMGIREACCRGEIEILRSTWPQQRTDWTEDDADWFEENKQSLLDEYGITLEPKHQKSAEAHPPGAR